MKMNYEIITSISALSLMLVLFIIPLKAEALVGSDFDPSSIISDTVFFNGKTMDPNQIQAFLNSKVPVCDTNHPAVGSNKPPFVCLKDYTQAVPTIAADSYCTQISGGGTVYSAAQIIHIVSQACSINPQVMLVLLQKEQGLITDTYPFEIQYRSATGYGCPDTAACDAEYYGYFNQIYNAARQFNRYVQLPLSFNYAVGRTSFVAYQANSSSCSGTNITIQNKATAALYNYTPYQPNGAALTNLYGEGDSCSAYGNRNFWRFFNDWFGSTHGDLVRSVNDSTVYLISDDAKYPIGSGSVLTDFSVLGPLRFVSDDYLASKATRPVLSRMVQGPDGSLYLVTAGIKLPFINCGGDVIDYGYTCEQGKYSPLTLAQTNKLHSGPAVTKLIRSNTNGTIYFMEKGKKRPILGWQDLLNLNIPISVNVFTDGTTNQFPTGVNLHGPSMLVKTANSATVYIVSSPTKLLAVSNFIFVEEIGFGTSTRTISQSDLDSFTLGSGVLSNKITCGAMNYIATAGKAYPISTTVAGVYGFSASEFIAGDGLCPNLKVSAQQFGRYIRNSSGTIFYVNDSQQKQAFSSLQSYVNHQNANGNPGYAQVSGFFEDRLTSGSNL